MSQVEQQEIETLKARLKQAGVTFHPNTGLDKLRTLVKEKLGNNEPKEETTSKEETLAQKKARISKAANRLVRVRVTCMNPNKKDWTGEVFRVSNKFSGDVTRFVPFNAEDGWHVPQIILNAMRERKCQVFKTITNRKNGMKTRKGYMINEFNIEELDPLNSKELEQLAAQQRAANEQDD